MKKMLIIDGHALMFRMYYAFLRRPMVNSKGTDTSIIFGFMKYLLELISKEHPTHLGVAFDPPAKTFRHEYYAPYKANREAAPEVVKESLQPLVELLESLDIPVLMVPGFEADDVIGSMAAKWGHEDFKIYMVSPDKDLGQLITDHVCQFKPGKSGAEDEVFGREEICAKYSISDPKQIIDILAIWGDAADNIPGVRGIGEVGAKKLVSRFGSVDEILRNKDRLTPKQAAAITASEEDLKLSRYLATIRTDIDLPFSEEDLKLETKDTSRAKELLREYECFSLVRLLPDTGTEENTPAAPEEKKVAFRKCDAAVLQKAAQSSGGLGLMLKPSRRETDCRLLLSAQDGDGMLVCGPVPPEEVRMLLEDPQLLKCGYDLKGTIRLLSKKGIRLEGYLADLEIMHYMINPETTHKLEILAMTYLNVNMDFESRPDRPEAEEEQTGDLFSQEVPATENEVTDRREEIGCALLLKVKEAVVRDMEAHGSALKLYDEVERPLIGVLAEMEGNGFRIDTGMLADYGAELKKVLAETEKKIREMVEEPELNISSPIQLGTVLFDKLKLDPRAKKNKRGNYTTDEETLREIEDRHPVIREILYFREVKKLLSTYIEPFPTLIDPETGKVHTTFNQALTATGRLSSAHPNLQNIPIRSELGKEIRKAFIASDEDSLIVSADYSQIELRIMAALSRDRHMCEAFRNGRDIHTATAARIFKEEEDQVTADQRRIAKTANFGIIYGISAFGLSQRLGIARNESKKLIEDYFTNYEGIAAYIEEMKQHAREKGYVETMFGRRRYLKDINSRNGNVRSFAERNAVNAPIQGSAADIIKMAMIRVSRALKEEGLKTRMILQVHDELIFDVPAEEKDKLMEIVRREMEGVADVGVPLLVDCGSGRNWLEAH